MGGSLGAISAEGARQGAAAANDAFSHSLARDFWLTNGLGSYAATSELGINSRKYHGLFVFTPDGNPSNSRLLLSKLEESVLVGGERIPLSSNCYPGAIFPDGHTRITKFEFDGAAARWIYSLTDPATNSKFSLAKEVWLPHHFPAAHVRYVLPPFRESPSRISLEVVPLVSCRPIHSIGLPKGIKFSSSHDAVIFTSPFDWSLSAERGDFIPHADTYYKMQYPLEQQRGEPYEEDLFTPGKFSLSIHRGSSATLSAQASLSGVPEGLLNRMEGQVEVSMRARRLISEFEAYNGFREMPHLSHLVLAADSLFTMHRGRRAIIAGLPYFGVWGRDMLLSIPGAAIYTGRHAIAREMISGILAFENEGLLPNYFDARGKPVYDAADVSLFAIWAIWHLEQEGGLRDSDRQAWWPTLKRIAAYCLRGNRLLSCGDDRLLSLTTPRSTWMDAQLDGKAVTPREGRRIEINALWVFALRYLSNFSAKSGDAGAADDLDDLHSDASPAFAEFFNEYAGYFDDGIKPTDGALRPNQLFALALPYLPITPIQSRLVLSQIREHLLTPCGIRTLAPADRNYHAHYGGSQAERDAAYHQGAVWPWLSGIYCDAILRHQSERASDLSRLLNQLISESRGSHGTIAEVYDPTDLTPNGCPTQAWSIAETLRASVMLYRYKYSSGRLPSLLGKEKV